MRAVNLIPAEQRGGTAVGMGRSGGAAYAVLAMCAGLAVMALLYGLADHQVSSRRAQVGELTAKAQRAQAAATALAPYTSFIALRQQRTQAVTQLVDSRFDWAHAFHELGRVLPASASVTSLSGTVGTTSASGAAPASASASASASTSASGSVTSSTPPGSVPTFTMAGCATSQAAVAETINRLRLIDGVSGVTLQSSTKSGAGGGASAGGVGGTGCPRNSPAFNVTITFQPLPTPSGTTPTSATVAASSEASSSASASKTAGTVR